MMFFAYHIRRSTTGSGRAATLRSGSPPSRLVAGTSEYIQLARTNAKASGPWKRNAELTALAGNSVQHAVSSRPLPSTTPGVSYGGCSARRHSALTAAPMVDGGDPDAAAPA
jgi:hypothetical protein